MVHVIAHRGASGYAPENTMAAFEKAAQMGAYGIETDVQLSADGEVVIAHDFVLDRISNGSGPVRALTLSQLKHLDFGSRFSKDYTGERIVTLDELLDFAQGNALMLNIEIKSIPLWYDKSLIALTEKRVRESGLMDRVLFSSFDHQCLRDMKALNPAARIGLLYEGGLLNAASYARQVGADALHPYYGYIDAVTVEQCRQDNVELNVWTVNDPAHILQMKKMGVNGIITNFPDLALQA